MADTFSFEDAQMAAPAKTVTFSFEEAKSGQPSTKSSGPDIPTDEGPYTKPPRAKDSDGNPLTRIGHAAVEAYANAPPLVTPSSGPGQWLRSHGMGGLTMPFAPVAALSALGAGGTQAIEEGATALGHPGAGRELVTDITNLPLAAGVPLRIAASSDRVPAPTPGEAPAGAKPLGDVTSEARTVLNNVKATRVPVEAAEIATKRTQQDVAAGKMTAVDVIDNLNKLRSAGKPAMLPDVLGANVTGEAGRVARAPGQAKEIMESGYRARNLEAVPRLTGDINKALGDTGAYQARQALEASRKNAAAPKYEAAFSRIKTTPEEAATVERFIRDPIGQDALQKGMRVIQLEKLAADEPFDPAEYGVARSADGKFVLQPGVPNLRLMDAVKRGYDEIVESFRDPVTGRLNLSQYGRAVNQVRATYAGDLRAMYPRYAAALDAWGGPSRSMDSLKFGENALTNPAEINKARLDGMTENDREFAKLGIAQKLRDIANSRGPLAAEFDRLVGTKYGASSVRNRLRPFFNSDEELQHLIDGVDAEIKMARKGNEIFAGSQTASRFAEDTGSGGAADVARMGISAATGHWTGVAHGLIRWLTNKTRTGNPEIDAEVARIMSDPKIVPEIGSDGKLVIRPRIPETAPDITAVGVPDITR